ncbi:MAG: tetratricopeptide repeat protein [Hyphomicrobiales bacterium]|nr:tetratricopeptide repeat protein [Hyphomicrobiales bacterium]MCY4038223.1 tetratricopeptide repeat protein [Hyphomicrobiales bacterium]
MLRGYLIALVCAVAVAFAHAANASSADFHAGIKAYAAGDIDTALDRWNDAAQEGHAGAAYLLANLYADGLAGSVQHHLAFRYYEQAAQAGHTEAQIALANYYRTGNEAAGIEVDLHKAHAWLAKAAYNRNAHAQYILGDMHTKGEGVEQNPHRGLRWFLLAAEKKYPLALARLGLIYSAGEIVTPDVPKGFMYMSLAAEEARGRERATIVAQYDRMLAQVTPLDRQLGLEMASKWRAERQALRR